MLPAAIAAAQPLAWALTNVTGLAAFAGALLVGVRPHGRRTAVVALTILLATLFELVIMLVAYVAYILARLLLMLLAVAFLFGITLWGIITDR